MLFLHTLLCFEGTCLQYVHVCVCVCCSNSLFVELCSPGIYRCVLLLVNSEVKAAASTLKTCHHVHLYMVYKLTCINYPLIFLC